MPEQERRTGIDRRQGQGAELRQAPFLTGDGVVYADRRIRVDRRFMQSEVTLLRENPISDN